MKLKSIINHVLLIAATLALAPNIWAESSEDSATSFRAPRQWRLGISVAGMLKEDLPSGAKFLIGPTSFWEFETSQRSSMAIHAAYRVSTNGGKLSQMGYGLILKHKLGTVSVSARDNWYLSYGLLLQVVRDKAFDSTGTAHDTKLCIGKDFGSDKIWFAEVSGHYSRLRYFNTENINLDYFELALGREI